ncbi:hypothetical protein COB57_00335 [Candidatus Peregrinibacteria bacterium]|nr:MAG: hypothetical protein COB57_00335 [Candidatus Peregrinibacteria bacterium]
MSIQKSKNLKVQTYCPIDSVDAVRQAIGNAGAGIIGNYSHCSFVTPGHGYFLPMEGSNPTIGETGKAEKVSEMKIEFVCTEELLEKVCTAIKDAHPYEEVPIEIFQMYSY